LRGVLRKKLRLPRSHVTALIWRQGKGALYPLGTALTRPLSTCPDTQHAPSAERRANALAPPPRATLWGEGKIVGFWTGPHTK